MVFCRCSLKPIHCLKLEKPIEFGSFIQECVQSCTTSAPPPFEYVSKPETYEYQDVSENGVWGVPGVPEFMRLSMIDRYKIEGP